MRYWALLVCLFVAGCGSDRVSAPLRVEQRLDPRDPLGVSGSLVGRWQARDGDGGLWVWAHSDSTLDCVVVFRSWTVHYLPGNVPMYDQHVDGYLVADLCVAPDGAVTSRLLHHTLPDSLEPVRMTVAGTYSDSLDFWVGTVWDTTARDWRRVYEYEPGFRLVASVTGNKLWPGTVSEELHRTGD